MAQQRADLTGKGNGKMYAYLRLVSPPDKREEIIRHFRRLMGPIGVQPGCTRCSCFSGLEDENTLLLLSEWKTKDDLAGHIKSREFMELLTVMDLSVGPPVMEFETITATAGLELVQLLRTQDEFPK